MKPSRSMKNFSICFFVLILIGSFFFNGHDSVEKLRVSYDFEETPEGISKYKQFIESRNQLISSYALNRVMVTVSFSEGISFDELNRMREAYHIDIKEVGISFMDENEDRITGMKRAEDGLLSVDEFFSEKYGTDNKIYTNFCGQIHSSQILKLQGEPAVFLVDTSDDMGFYGNMNWSSLLRNNINFLRSGTNQYPNSISWYVIQPEKLEKI